AITGLDLVRLQLEIATGRPLPFEQSDVRADGHAVEARLYAEDPSRDFLPSVGRVHRFVPPDDGVRWDSGVESGSEVSPHFDGLLAKAIAHAPTRNEAVAKVARALRGLHVHGPETNRDMLVAVLESDAFGCADTSIEFLERHPELFRQLVPEEVQRAHAE